MCSLELMKDSQFQIYVTKAISSYASELIKSGEVPEKMADMEAKKAFYGLLPEGTKTLNQFLFNIVHENQQIIGMIWYGLRPHQEGFIYDFEIDEVHRGKGYGKEALILLEAHAKSLGINKLGLRVFGHNENAYALYKKMGYIPYSINMSKEI